MKSVSMVIRDVQLIVGRKDHNVALTLLLVNLNPSNLGHSPCNSDKPFSNLFPKVVYFPFKGRYFPHAKLYVGQQESVYSMQCKHF